MKDATLIEALTLDEVVDGAASVPVQRQVWRLDNASPLGVERTVASAGARRGVVVLLHGFAQNRFTWRLSRRSLVAALAQSGFEVLNLELRGHGHSHAFGSRPASRFEDYVEDLTSLLRRLDEPPLVMVHSLGAAVAYGAAAAQPIRGLVSLAGVSRFARHNRSLRSLAQLSAAAGRWLPVGGLRVRTAPVGSGIARWFDLADLAGFGLPVSGWAPGSIERDLLAERVERGFDWTSAEVWLQMSRWAAGAPLVGWEAFQQAQTPVLFVGGSADPLVTPQEVEEAFRGCACADKQLLVFEPFEHRTHWGHLDLVIGRLAPEIVWPRLIDWLQARSGSSGGR
jgi:alpha-beta hydrolase superfamily lysophospholipase